MVYEDQQKFETILADAGYESERFHKLCRERLNIESIIPTTQRGRPRQDGKSKAVTGHYRKLIQNNFPKNIYGQRRQIETVFSMLKRNLGSAIRARNHHSQTCEIRLRVLTHNLMILRRITYVLYRAGLSPIFSFLFSCHRIPSPALAINLSTTTLFPCPVQSS